MATVAGTQADDERKPVGKRILVIGIHYPPSGSAAAIRARNLVRNLQALGHEVHVITARHPGDGATPPEAQALRWLDVENLARRLVRRNPRAVGGLPPARPWQRRMRWIGARLLVPDLYATWIPGAALAARRQAKNADVVISTGGASAHVVARLVRGSRPAIVDVNDLWWQNARGVHGPIRDRVNRVIEGEIIRGAGALIVPVREQGLEVERRWGRPSATVLTGFDPLDFRARHTNGSHPHRREIVFAGTLYENFRLDVLFQAVAKGRSDHGWTAADLGFVFIGRGSGTAVAAAHAHGVDEFVQGVPPLPRVDVLGRLVLAEALLLPLYAEDPYHIPMRFFEFVGAGRPILGIGSPTVPAGRFIEEHRLGVVCENPTDLVAAVNQLMAGPRQPDLPIEKRAIFESATARPVLRQLIEQAAG